MHNEELRASFQKHGLSSESQIDPLKGSSADFRDTKGRHLLDRNIPLANWAQIRKTTGHWQHTRALVGAPLPNAATLDINGQQFDGLNFAVQDYLGLATHPDIIAVAQATAAQFGVHSAGSCAFLGNSTLSWRLEETIAKFLRCQHALLFPTGWAAAFGVVQGLVRKHDYLVIDQLAHASLQTGAITATENIIRFRHNSPEHLRKKLGVIRAKDANAGILVVIESLYSMDSDSPDICHMQEIASEFDAILMVDAAHDIGNLGPGGTGHLGAQGMLGKVDIVMGSFSKTFASNGGYVASSHPAVKEYLRWFSSSWTFSNGLSPIQCAVVQKSFDIVQSQEGEMLRQSLSDNVNALRKHLLQHRLDVLGDPSAIVPVVIGDVRLARTASRLLPHEGVFANLAEFPAVPIDKSRFRMQVMATHTEEDVRKGAEGVAMAIEKAKMILG